MDRVSIRERPPGWPIMHQRWGRLLFAHWSFDRETIRPLVPDALELDLFEGRAWVGLVPFTMWGIRPVGVPAVPGLSAFHELNVRTYVHHRGVPGVWFLSLDAASAPAVWGARTFFHLPYFRARMQLETEGATIRYASERTDPRGPAARFRARWTAGDARPEAAPGTLDFFLVERYCLYALRGQRLGRCRIQHPPWPLRDAALAELDSTLLASHGLARPDAPPVLHAADEIAVRIWPLRRVEG